MALIGVGEFSLRAFSLELGMIALTLTGWLARLAARARHGTSLKGIDLVTAVLLAAIPGMAFYVRDARMYSLAIVWAVLAAGLLLRDWVPLTKWPRWTSVLALIIINGLAIFTHYYLILIIFAQPLTLLVTKRWRPFWAWLGAHSIPALAGLFWLSLATGLQQSIAGAFSNIELSIPTTRQITSLLAALLASSMSRPQFYVLPIVLVMLAGGMLVAWRRQWRVGAWLLLMFGVPFVLAFLLPREPQPRYLVYLLPFIALAIAHLIGLPANLTKFRVVQWILGFGLTALTSWLLFNAGLVPVLTLEKSRYGQTLETVSKHARPGDEALFYGPWQMIPFHYYDPGGMPPFTLLPPQAPPLLDPIQAEPVLETMLARASRLWVIPMADAQVDPDLFVWDWLRKNAHDVWQQDDFHLYLPPLPGNAPTKSTAFTFGQALELEKIAFQSGPIAAGEPIRLTLFWQSLQTLDQGADLALTLIDEKGLIWNIADSSLENDATPATLIDYQGLMIPQGAPPGEYAVRLRVLDKASGSPLLVNGEEGVVLYSFQVVDPVQEAILDAAMLSNNTQYCQTDESICLTLIGVEPGGDRFQPGFPLPLELHWKSPSYSLPELQATLRIIPDPLLSWPGAQFSPIMTETMPLVSGYPTNSWTPRRLVTLPLLLSIPPDAPAGRTSVTMTVEEANGRSWTTAGAVSSTLFHFTMEKRPTLTKMPAGLTPLGIDFDGVVGLRGYRVEGSACPGGRLELTYAWYAISQPTKVYAVFNHLVTINEEQQVAQIDGWPQEGRLLTKQWQPGEYIEDSYILDIPQDALPGPYFLYVGFYDAISGVRLSAFQDGQQLPENRVPITLTNACE